MGGLLTKRKKSYVKPSAFCSVGIEYTLIGRQVDTATDVRIGSFSAFSDTASQKS